MIEAFEGLSALGWGNAILVFLFSIIFAVAFIQGVKFLFDFFGIKTRKSIKEEKRDKEIEKLKADISKLQEDIKNIDENRTHDREQSFKIQKDLVDNFAQVSNTLAEIKNDILEDKIERKRWNILNFADELRQNDGVADNERYNNVFRDYDDYERIIHDRGLSNGYVEESIKFIRLKYQEMLND